MSVSDVLKTVKTTCAYCGVGCGIRAEITGPRSVTIKGDTDHPANYGRLCSKGTYLGETVALEGRLLHPMIGGKKASWDEASGEVATRLVQTIAKYGPESVGFYVSGQLLTEDYYAINKLAKGFVGTANIDTNSRLCMASAVAAHMRAFGEDLVPCSYSDLETAELIILLGSNTSWCHPVVWQRIEAARAKNGCKLVVIDPRRTQTAALADLHIPVAPDGDVALFNALLAEMSKRGLCNDEFMADHCQIPDGFFDGLDADAHGIDPQIFAQLCDLVADNPRMVTMFSQGANQSVGGTDKGNAITNLHLAMGRISKDGAGPFSITGQPNAMGGREVGGLASTLACHLGFSDDERAAVGHYWNAANMCEGPGLKAVDLFRAIDEGKVKFLWVMATNPAVSMPDTTLVRRALERCPTVVVSDVLENTDTGQYAHIRLPALAWGEKDGTVTNSERLISRQRALFEAPGEARGDWDIVCDVARRMGFENGFSFPSQAAVFREYAGMTRLSGEFGKLLDLREWADCSDAEYEAMESFQWGGKHPCKNGFATPSGKANLVAVTAPPPAQENAQYPLRLNTGRYRDQWHTMTRTGLSAKLSQHRREPLLEVHPDDALAAGMEDGGLARVRTAHGASIYRVEVSEGQRLGDIFVPMHWTDMNSGAGRTGRLCHPLVDPVSGQPAFKNTPAAVEAVSMDWRAFLISRDPVSTDAPYWARSRINGGWLTEIAGMGALDLDALLPKGPRSEVADMARGMRRLVVSGHDGEGESTIIAQLYITRSGDLPEKDWLIREFSKGQASMGELLAGRSAAPLPDRGKLVCLCHDVGEKDICKAVADGADSVEAIGKATCAGTNCGSCRPIIAELLKSCQIAADEPAQLEPA